MGQIIRPLLTPRRRQSLSPAVYCCVIVCVHKDALIRGRTRNSYQYACVPSGMITAGGDGIGRLANFMQGVNGVSRRGRASRCCSLKCIPIGAPEDMKSLVHSSTGIWTYYPRCERFRRSFTSSPCGGWNRSVYHAGWRGWAVYSSKPIAERWHGCGERAAKKS